MINQLKCDEMYHSEEHMDSVKCRALLEVLERKSISDAARRLGYTPSGISRIIDSLEEEVGFPLIIRNRANIEPTTDCETILPAMKELSFWARQITQLSEQIGGVKTGFIRIGTSYRTYYPWLTHMIVKFSQSYPQVKFSISEASSSELLLAMQEHKIDFCIISQREGEYQWIPLQENEVVACLPPNHPLADAASYPIVRLETDSYIETYPHQDTDNARIRKKLHIKANTCFSTSDQYAALRMVEAGLGVCLNNGINAANLLGNVVYKTLDPPQSVVIGIATPSKEMQSPALRAFLTVVKDSLEESGTIVSSPMPPH